MMMVILVFVIVIIMIVENDSFCIDVKVFDK